MTDSIINGTLILLQQRYGVPGLQNLALDYTLSFATVGTTEFVQALNSANNQCLTQSTIEDPYSHVQVYDSLYSDIPKSTKEQICALLTSTESSIQLNYANVQQQMKCSDCGLYALAFCTSLCAD